MMNLGRDKELFSVLLFAHAVHHLTLSLNACVMCTVEGHDRAPG